MNTQQPIPGVTWTNGRVALAKDLVFGLVVMTENGWFPVDQLDADDVSVVWDAVDFNPGFPFKDELAAIRAKKPRT